VPIACKHGSTNSGDGATPDSSGHDLDCQAVGRLSAAIGHDRPDVLLAATALEHDRTMVTRNLRHFEPLGVRTLNPYG